MSKDIEWSYVETALKEMMETNDSLYDAGQKAGLVPESIFYTSKDTTDERLIQTLEMLVYDGYGNIEWYVRECDYGRLPKEAGIDGDMRLIDSVEKLRWLVELN